MATMIPDNVEMFTTPGEKEFYRFLQAVALPHHRYLCWYLPEVQGREPDFILYSEDVGLVIFEFKDWVLDQIVGADKLYFTLLIGDREEKRQNPQHQVRDYFHKLMNRIREDRHLVSKEAHSYGNVKIPVSTGIVFSNINKYEYRQKGFDDVIPTEQKYERVTLIKLLDNNNLNIGNINERP